MEKNTKMKDVQDAEPFQQISETSIINGGQKMMSEVHVLKAQQKMLQEIFGEEIE